MKTKVTFKKVTYLPYEEDEQTTTEIVAIFPDEVQAVINGEKHYLCYAHLGQHSEIHESFLYSPNATKEEYNSLYLELLSVGYDLHIV